MPHVETAAIYRCICPWSSVTV